MQQTGKEHLLYGKEAVEDQLDIQAQTEGFMKVIQTQGGGAVPWRPGFPLIGPPWSS